MSDVSVGAHKQPVFELLGMNVAWQTMVVRKVRKMVMISEIVEDTTYKTSNKKIRIFDHEKNVV